MSTKNNNFDKFMKEIVKKEQRQFSQGTNRDEEETPQRRYRKLYAERWQNRIKWGPRGQKREQ